MKIALLSAFRAHNLWIMRQVVYLRGKTTAQTTEKLLLPSLALLWHGLASMNNLKLFENEADTLL